MLSSTMNTGLQEVYIYRKLGQILSKLRKKESSCSHSMSQANLFPIKITRDYPPTEESTDLNLELRGKFDELCLSFVAKETRELVSFFQA